MATRKSTKTSLLPTPPVWQFKTFEELSFEEYHAILKLRGQVYASDQKLQFEDADGLDPHALHLTAVVDSDIVAYARILPHDRKREAMIGRMVVAAPHRKTTIAKELLTRALAGVDILLDPQPVRVNAPERVKSLYERFGFEMTGERYDEAGVPHVRMLRNAHVNP